MLRKFSMMCLVGISLAMVTSPASAFGLIRPIGSAPHDLFDISFWGRPFPYGHTGWGRCIRYVEVQTPWGLRLRRVRVCR